MRIISTLPCCICPRWICYCGGTKRPRLEGGTSIINKWEQFPREFKKSLYSNNIVYEVKRMFWELKQTGIIRANVKEFTTLTL